MIVTVKDLKEYLDQFDPETRIGLDKDGWMENEIKAENPVDLIRKRGLFWEGKTALVLNN